MLTLFDGSVHRDWMNSPVHPWFRSLNFHQPNRKWLGFPQFGIKSSRWAIYIVCIGGGSCSGSFCEMVDGFSSESPRLESIKGSSTQAVRLMKLRGNLQSEMGGVMPCFGTNFGSRGYCLIEKHSVQIWLQSWLVVTGTWILFSHTLGKNHHPNWRTHIFQRCSNHQPDFVATIDPGRTRIDLETWRLGGWRLQQKLT